MLDVRILILLAMLFALPAEAQVRKCVSADGKTSYQDEPCPGKSKGAWVKKKMDSETHGGESAAAIEKRAAALRQQQYNDDQAKINARAAAIGAQQPPTASPGLSPSKPMSTSGGGGGCTNCTSAPRTR